MNSFLTTYEILQKGLKLEKDAKEFEEILDKFPWIFVTPGDVSNSIEGWNQTIKMKMIKKE